jgi:hypothetical protein
MNTRQVVSGLVVAVALAIAFAVGRQFQPRTTCPQNTKCINISKLTGGKCQVDSPIMNMKYIHHVQWWSADDHQYAVSFLKITPPSGSQFPPLPNGYVPGKNPLIPHEEPVIVPANSHSDDFTVQQKEDYYLYAIFDLTVDPNSYTSNNPNPCKVSTDDSDTRLVVKP